MPALRPADGSVGEESGAHRKQPTTQSQGEQGAGILREAVPRDPQATRAAGAHAEVRFTFISLTKVKLFKTLHIPVKLPGFCHLKMRLEKIRSTIFHLSFGGWKLWGGNVLWLDQTTRFSLPVTFTMSLCQMWLHRSVWRLVLVLPRYNYDTGHAPPDPGAKFRQAGLSVWWTRSVRGSGSPIFDCVSLQAVKTLVIVGPCDVALGSTSG